MGDPCVQTPPLHQHGAQRQWSIDYHPDPVARYPSDCVTAAVSRSNITRLADAIMAP